MKNLTHEQLLKLREYNPNDKPQPDSVVFKIEQKNIGSLGNFVTLSGLPKRGKGKFMSAITASALTGNDIWGLRCFLPEGRRRVCYFDTDQSRYDFYKNIELINQLSEIETIHPNLNAFNVRRDEPAAICNMIDVYLKLHADCGIVLIDNIGDLLNNFNDEGQSKKLINYFKRITDEKNILIITTLHLGKGNNSTIGHLGAMSDRYAQTTLVCEKVQSVYTLNIKDSRTAGDITPLAIHYNEFSRTWESTITDTEQKNVRPIKARPQDLNIEDHKYKCKQIFDSQAVYLYDDLIKTVKEFYNCGRNWAIECISHCRDEKIIEKIPEGYRMAATGARLYIEK